MKTRSAAVAAAVAAIALIAAACAPPPETTWKVRPVSITVHDKEDADPGDEPYAIQIGFRSKVGVPNSSQTSISSQCSSNQLPPTNAAPNGTTVAVPPGSVESVFPGVRNLEVNDLGSGEVPFELIGTLTFIMERDGIFASCAVTDALRTALLGTLRQALDALVADSSTPPDADALVDILVANLGSFIEAAGSLIAAVLEGLGDPDDIIGVAAQIHLPTRGVLTDLIQTGLAIGGLFSPGLEQGFIPVEDLPSTLKIRVGTLSPSAANFDFTGPGYDYSYRSEISAGA